MTEQKINPKSLGGFVRSLSGFFITKEIPGLTPKELSIITALLFLLKQKNTTVVSKVIKEELSNLTNQSFQVTTNYLNKLRKKNVIIDDKIHPIFLKDKITIEYGENIL